MPLTIAWPGAPALSWAAPVGESSLASLALLTWASFTRKSTSGVLSASMKI